MSLSFQTTYTTACGVHHHGKPYTLASITAVRRLIPASMRRRVECTSSVATLAVLALCLVPTPAPAPAPAPAESAPWYRAWITQTACVSLVGCTPNKQLHTHTLKQKMLPWLGSRLAGMHVGPPRLAASALGRPVLSVQPSAPRWS